MKNLFSWLIKLVLWVTIYILSKAIELPMTVLGILWQILRGFKQLPNYFQTMSGSVDQTGNVSCAKMFNDILIDKNGYKFGNEDEKISSVLGKNKLSGNLISLGKWLSNRLNSVDKNHVENSIDLTETDDNLKLKK